jgi:hypothetical protein
MYKSFFRVDARIRKTGRTCHDGNLVCGCSAEVRYVPGVPERSIQAVKVGWASGWKECRRRAGGILLQPPAHVIQRAILEHHDYDVLNLVKYLWHESNPLRGGKAGL